MLRRVFTLLSILCLVIAPGLAAAHLAIVNTQPAGIAAMPAHGSMHQMEMPTPAKEGTCSAQDNCAKDSAICASVCAGLIAIQSLPATVTVEKAPRMAWALPGNRHLHGLTPQPDDRPPNAALL
jgi:hypothetical protein